MEENLFKNNTHSNQTDIYEDYTQRILFYKKYDKKKGKYIICSNNEKVFYSDDEDENFYQNLNLINKYMNPNIIKSKRKLSQNIVITCKDKLHKKNTIINKNEFDKIINNPQRNIKNKKNKKVHFLDVDFVKFIDVESYKKYNSLYTNKYSSDEIQEYANAKCTCNIF